ncbi:MAG: HAMP domain-containing protein [Planctomycetota bacterium]|nr:MAG: HAMP domain-containing protein [Planctomycetota bacterium]
MSLQTKIVLMISAVVSIYAALDYASLHFFVLPSFISFEHDEAQKSMRRCVGDLKREIYHLETTTKNWTQWSDIYEFVEDRNDAYISTDLLIECFAENNLNLIYICNAKNEVVWGQIRDPETEETIQLNQFPAGSLPKTHPLLGHKFVESSTAGVFITDRAPMLVASRPIISSKNKGLICGTLIIGRFLSDNAIQALAQRASVELKVWSIANNSIPAKEKDAIKHIKARSQFHVRELSKNILQTYTLLPDIKGAPALLMRADIPRDIRARGLASLIRSTLLSILTAGLTVLLVLLILLRRMVVSPIKKLTNHIIAIGKSNYISAGLPTHRSDEIGTLAREFEHMVQKLREAQKKLLEQSYHLGMAEMASGVLHNIRNALTPMISHIDGLRQKLREAPIEKIEIAQAELSDGSSSDKRREELTSFINLSRESLFALIRETNDKLDNVAKEITQIEGMLKEQSKFSRMTLPSEEVKLDEVVRESLALLPSELRDAISIEIEPSIESSEPVMTHSITLLQVFNNILINAAESIVKAGSIQGKICIRAAIDEVNGLDMVHVQFSDNGVGIEPQHLHHIFERGFSTKRSLSGGIGLHWCANTISRMKGRIYAESEGRNRGACFHILLPTSRKAVSVLDEKMGVRA